MCTDYYLDQIADTLKARKKGTLGGCLLFAKGGAWIIVDGTKKRDDPSFVYKLSDSDVTFGLSPGQWSRITNHINHLIEKGILCEPPKKS